MKEFLDKVKNIYEEKIVPFIKTVMEKAKPYAEKVLPFMIKNKRYLATAGLFVVFVLVLIFFTGDEFNSKRIAKINSREVSGEDYEPEAEFEVNAYAELNELIQTYFDAYVNADFETLRTVAYPISEMEESYITTMSQFYEAYQNVSCYTKHGLSKDSYIVAARFDIKFVGQEVTAPSMVLFYVQTDENGVLYINNLYSDFNMQYAEQEIRQDVYTALRKYTIQDDYLELYNEVEVAFNTLIKENTEIQQLTKRTIPGTRQQWEDSVYYVQQDTENVDGSESTELADATETPVASEETPEQQPDPEQEEPEAEPEEEQEPEAEPEEEEEEPEAEPEEEEEEPEAQVEKIKIIDVSSNLNVREEADRDSDDIGDVYEGEEYVKLGVETDDNGDEWTKIQYEDDTVGYIMSKYTEEVTEE